MAAGNAGAVAGLLGWGSGCLLLQAAQQPPVPAWSVAAGLLVIAAVVAGLAWNVRRRLTPDPAVRARTRVVSPLVGVRYLAVAKACFHAGGALAGFYAGLALALFTQLHVLQWSLLAPCLAASAASLPVLLAGWFLERSCRVQPPDDPPGVPAAAG